MIEKKRGLGRGLEDLLSTRDWLKGDDIQLFYCPIDRLIPNPYQPRQTRDDERMEELVQSIHEKGVLQPILASRTDVADQYQILAGERRWRAAQRAGLSEVPILLRESTPAEALECALIENIQRQDLNCVEESLAYQRLQDEFHLTQEQIAQRVGKSRSTVANLLRLLQLPPDIQESILNRELTMGHARALLAVPDPDEQRRITDLIVAQDLSVRETERLIAQLGAPKRAQPEPDPRSLQLQDTLQTHLGTRVLLRRRGDAGSITIAFRSDEELTRLLHRFGIDS